MGTFININLRLRSFLPLLILNYLSKISIKHSSDLLIQHLNFCTCFLVLLFVRVTLYYILYVLLCITFCTCFFILLFVRVTSYYARRSDELLYLQLFYKP